MPADTLHPPTTSGNGRQPPGHDTPPDRRRPPRPPGPSTRPAMVVIAIAAVVLLVGGIGAALTSSGGSTNPRPGKLHTASGATITAVADGGAFRPIESAGQPPADVLDAIVLPEGASVRSKSATDNGVGLFDRSLSFQIGVTQSRVIDFFRAELEAFRWQLVSQGPASNDPGYRIVGQHPSSDGYEWEIGVTVEPSTFGRTSLVTAFTIRLFVVTDA
jgi:hypothetical protein